MDDIVNDQKRKNRKRKKNFLSNARKYGKKGNFGRGSHLNEDTYQYFVRVLETHKNGFETEEEKATFANNVLEQTENEEVNYSCNQIGCRVIETLLPSANPDVLNRFCLAFSSKLRPTCNDSFASHVLQALHTACCKLSPSNNENNDINTCKEFTIKLAKFLLNNLEDYVEDLYGNHIIRTILDNFSTKLDDNSEYIPENVDIIKEFAIRLMSWPQFKDFPFNEKTSGLLQNLLKAICKTDGKLMETIQRNLINDSYSVCSDNSKGIADVFDNKPALFLLELSLELSSGEIYKEIYEKCFVGKIVVLAKNKMNNFAVRKLLDVCSEKTELESIFNELSPNLQEIIQLNHVNVLFGLSSACLRLSHLQGQFVQQLMQALHCNEPAERQEHIVPAILHLKTFEELQQPVEDKKYFINMLCSKVIQDMLNFNKPIKVVTSILGMNVGELEKLFIDTKGSRILDVYVTSKFVGEKSREKLIRKLKGTYHTLVTTKFGSRSFDSIWNVASLKQKSEILQELSYKDASWVTNEFGRIIASRVNIQLFKRNQDEWKQFIGKADKTKNMFEDIFE